MVCAERKVGINIDTARLVAATEALHDAVLPGANEITIKFPMSMIPKNGRRSSDKVARSLNSLTVPASRSQTFRKMAADALRAGRKAAPGDDREAHFSTAASYKSL